MGGGRRALDEGERFVFAEGDEFVMHHVVHGDGGAAKHGGGGGVVRREDQRDLMLHREIDHRL